MAHIPFTMDMDIDSNIIRERFASSSKNCSKELLILSNALSIAYHKCMEVMNNILSKDIWKLVDSLQLSYSSKNGDIKGKLVSKMTNINFQGRHHV